MPVLADELQLAPGHVVINLPRHATDSDALPVSMEIMDGSGVVIDLTNRPAEKPLSAGTLKTYKSVMASFVRKGPQWSLYDADKIIAEFNNDEAEAYPWSKNLNSRATLLAALYHATKLEPYRTEMHRISGILKERYQEQKAATPRISYGEACARHTALLEKVADVTTASPQDLQLAIITGLACGAYPEFPPRRLMDLTELKFRDFDKDSDNYVNLNLFRSLGTSAPPTLVFNKYKTAASHGQVELSVPAALRPALEQLCATRELFSRSNYLFCDKGAHQLTSPTLCRMLKSVFGCSVDTLRSIFLSDMYKDMPPLKEMEATAEGMGHSVAAALSFYVKKD